MGSEQTSQACLSNGMGALRLSFVAFTLVIALNFCLTKPVESGYAAYILDVNSGAVLHSRNGNTQNFPASICKVMTLYVVFKGLDDGKFTLATMVPISQRASQQPASKIGFKAGDSIMLQDAILALTTKSANDIATAVAEFVSGTERNFADEMTRTAKNLGMTRTTFRNASGLPNSRQKTTAKDLITLGVALYRDFPHYTHYFSQKKFTYRGRTYRNHNNLLGLHEGVDGIKTGYIRAAGYNLMVSARYKGHHLIGVVLGGKTAKRRDAQMVRLLKRAYDRLNRNDKLFASISRPHHKPNLTSYLEEKIISISPVKPPDDLTISLESQQVLPEAREYTEGIIDGNLWSVQLGAFSRYNAAERVLDSVVPLFPKLLANTRKEISEVTDSIGTLYRARHVGLTESLARQVCEKLKTLSKPCMISPPRPSS